MTIFPSRSNPLATRAVSVVIATLATVAVVRLLWVQPGSMRGQWYPISAYLSVTHEGEETVSQVSGAATATTRGMFSVEEYWFFENIEENGVWRRSPLVFPAGSTIGLAHPPHRAFRGMFEDLVAHHTEARSRFVGRVWLRREALWGLFALACIAALWSGASLAATIRRLRRFKKGLCTRCAYPLPMEQAEPRCPECGTLHIP